LFDWGDRGGEGWWGVVGGNGVVCLSYNSFLLLGYNRIYSHHHVEVWSSIRRMGVEGDAIAV
jgi:hypothetical protein